MADITFEEIVQAARKLNPQQKAALAHALQIDAAEAASLTRERAVSDLEALRAADAFANIESLRGKYARRDADPDEAELNAYLHEIGTEWEQELDDFAADT